MSMKKVPKYIKSIVSSMTKCASIEALMKLHTKLGGAIAESLINPIQVNKLINPIKFKMVGNAYYIGTNSINTKVFFVCSVEQDISHKDIVNVSGVVYHPANSVYSTFYRIEINSVCFRSDEIHLRKADGSQESWKLLTHKDTEACLTETNNALIKVRKNLAKFSTLHSSDI